MLMRLLHANARQCLEKVTASKDTHLRRNAQLISAKDQQPEFVLHEADQSSAIAVGDLSVCLATPADTCTRR